MSDERYDWLFARRPGSTRIELLDQDEWRLAKAEGAQCYNLIDLGQRRSVEDACRMAREQFERMPLLAAPTGSNMTFSDEQATADHLLNG